MTTVVRSLTELAALAPHLGAGGLDPVGVAAAWGRARADDRTAFASARIARPSTPPPRHGVALDEALVVATARVLAGCRHVAVALGGGIDAPVAVLAARRAGVDVHDAIHVAVPGTSYDERDSARALAEALDLDLRVVETTADALASRLPRAVRLTATPLYNLHPVSRVLACEAALAIGADALLTGDGADQVAARAAAAPDYVPIVEAIVRGSGLRLAAPFLDDEVGAALVSKEQLRALARTWGVPASHAHAPKRPAWAPPLPRAHFPADDIVARLARALDLPLGWSDDDRTNVGIASLAALVAAFDVGSV